MPNNKKYLTEGIHAEPRRITEEICKKNKDVKWIHKFRQWDINNVINPLFTTTKARNQAGHCQIISSMYMHIREQTKGYPTVTRRLFKYWCFLYDKTIENKPWNKKNLSEKEISDWKSMVEIEKQQWRDWKEKTFKTKEEYQQFIDLYFSAEGVRSLVSLADYFWQTADERMDVVQNAEKKETVSCSKLQLPTGPGKESISTVTLETLDDETTYDLDFMHEVSPDYYLMSSKEYAGQMDLMVDAIVHEVFNAKDANGELRLLVNLHSINPYSHTDNGPPHSVSFTQFADDSNIEFVDANRGIFLIPSNSKESLRNFLLDYLKQKIYDNYKFNTVKIESYINKESLVLDSKMQAMIALQERNIKTRRDDRSNPLAPLAVTIKKQG